MTKIYLPIAAVVLVVLNGLLLVPAISAYTVPITILALLVALLVLVLSLTGGRASATSAAPAAPVGVPTPAATPVTAPPVVPVANQAEGEIAAFLGLLQEKGRLVDFLMEDVTAYDDAQVGAAARVIHQGCKEILQEHFRITAVSGAQEGSQITVPAGYAPDEYRLVGKISGTPPFTGKLIHKGWKTEYVKLPRLTKTERLPAIAPAEVELE
jgi:Domain of unknown function (DUF2760)